MASKPKQRMSVSDRAKQFMPFSALKGLDEALAAKERQIVGKKELSEDKAALLTRKLTELKTGDKVSITYFSGGVYVNCTGKVSKINTVNREVTIVKKPIPIDDIYDITTEE